MLLIITTLYVAPYKKEKQFNIRWPQAAKLFSGTISVMCLALRRGSALLRCHSNYIYLLSKGPNKLRRSLGKNKTI